MSFFKMPTLHSIVIHDFLSSLPVVKYLALLKTGILHLSEEKQLLVVQRGLEDLSALGQSALTRSVMFFSHSEPSQISLLQRGLSALNEEDHVAVLRHGSNVLQGLGLDLSLFDEHVGSTSFRNAPVDYAETESDDGEANVHPVDRTLDPEYIPCAECGTLYNGNSQYCSRGCFSDALNE
jgi:hypothetical protein